MWYFIYLAVYVSVIGVVTSVYNFNIWQTLLMCFVMSVCGLLGYYDAKDKYE